MGEGVEGYQQVAELKAIPDGGCLAIEFAGEAIVLVRQGDRVTALENRCPHAGAPLSEGCVEGRTITCAWHGWTFSLDDGQSLDGADLSVPCHDVRVTEGAVLIRLRSTP